MSFKQIPNLSNYEINENGIIRNIKTGNIIKSRIDIDGYEIVTLNNKPKRVHRLLAVTFIENDDPINKIHVDHIDANRSNNSLSNLQWITRKDNNIKRYDQNFGPVMTYIKINPYTELDSDKYVIMTQKEIKDAGFDFSHVIKCCKENKKYKTHKGFQWKYNIPNLDLTRFKPIGIIKEIDLSHYKINPDGIVINENNMIKKSQNATFIRLSDKLFSNGKNKEHALVITKIINHVFNNIPYCNT